MADTATWECAHGFCDDCTSQLLGPDLRPIGLLCTHPCHVTDRTLNNPPLENR